MIEYIEENHDKYLLYKEFVSKYLSIINTEFLISVIDEEIIQVEYDKTLEEISYEEFRVF